MGRQPARHVEPFVQQRTDVIQACQVVQQWQHGLQQNPIIDVSPAADLQMNVIAFLLWSLWLGF